MQFETDIKILTIDDDNTIRKAIAAFLEDRGYIIMQAENGWKGLEQFRNENPDLILVDLRMPEMNGFEVLNAVKEESPETPIIVVSGVGVIQEAIEAIRAGAWDFVTKPIDDMSILEHVIQRVWERAVLSRENRKYRENLEEKTKELEKSLDILHKTQDQLIVQEKLASLGTLTAGIAHEIKNPLNFIVNFAEECVSLTEELREEMTKLEEQRDEKTVNDLLDLLEKSASKVHKHGHRADNIVQSMLLHSRIKGGEWQLSGVNAILEEYMNLAYHSMRAKDQTFNATMESSLDASFGKIKIIPQDLGRVFLNVLNNAFYAVQEKVQKNEKEYTPLIKVSTQNLGDQIEIRIWDNGVGIPQKHINQIFEPFFTTKPPGSGTGLGLSLSYEIIVQEHQGELEVHSEEEKFTEFILTLPKRD